MMDLKAYPPGFEECDKLRSAFVRDMVGRQVESSRAVADDAHEGGALIPKRLVRYWHDPADLPADVRACLESWDRLFTDEGFESNMFDDASAAAFIKDAYGERELQAFARCGHPAMRCDYLRMCFILAEGGLYVDADDVLIGDGWRHLFRNGSLKVQPLCYDVSARTMMPASEFWRPDPPTAGPYRRDR